MKKSSVYTCFISLSSLGYVLQAKCACPAGIMAATLFGLDSFHKKKNSMQSEESLSCTSKPCSWSVPPKRKGQVSPIGEMKFCKHNYDKEARQSSQSLFTPGKDVRAPHQQSWTEEKLKLMLEQLQKLQQQTGQRIGWCHILPQEIPQEDNEDLSLATINQQCQQSIAVGCYSDIISSIKAHESPISLAGIKGRCARVKKKLLVTKEIEKETREQSNSPLWFQHRRARITASKCYRVAVMRPSTSLTKAIKEILYSKVKPTREMKEGLEKEPEIIAEYIQHQINAGHVGLKVSKCGLLVSEAEGFLGANPDGLVEDPSTTDPHGLLEMKYIQTDGVESLEEDLVRKRICVKNNTGLTVNRQHQYFYQMQQVMYVSQRNWIDLAVKGSQSSKLYIERVDLDQELWKSVKEKLHFFFDRHICPELAYPQVKFWTSTMEGHSRQKCH